MNSGAPGLGGTPVKLHERYVRPGTGPDQFERTLDGLLTAEQQTNVRAPTMAGAW